MQNYNPLYEEKIVIHCKYCINKLRVPADKGKLSIKCPVCGQQFIYNPNSIFHTFRQIMLSVVYGFPKSRKTRIIVITAVIAVVVALLLLIFSLNNSEKTNISPRDMVFENNSIYLYNII